MSILLSIIALILFVIVHIVYNIVMLFTDVKNRKWYQLIDAKAFTLAFNIDVFGNYQYRKLWNLIFSKQNKGYQFGRFGETISSVLGKKLNDGTLSFFGWIMACLIDAIDFSKWKSGFKGNGFHCVASIQTEAEINSFITSE